MQSCFRQTSRYILNIAKRLISPNSNPPTPTHPSAFRRAQTEADAWSQHLVNYLALFILPEIKNLMSVSSTFGYNEHIRTAQNACEPTNIFFRFSSHFFLFRSLTNQCQHLPHNCSHTHPVSTRTESVKNACERAYPLFCNACFSIVSLLLGLLCYLHNVWEYSIKPVIL